MPQTSLQKACLTVGLATAWGAVSDAQADSRIHFETSLGSDLTHARLMLGGTGSGALLTIFDRLTLPGSGSGDIFTTIPGSGLADSFVLMGIYHGSGGGDRLLVSFPGLTIIVNHTFEDVFPGYSETLLIDQLLHDAVSPSDFMISTYALTAVGHGSGSMGNDFAHCAAFSLAEDVGTVRVGVFDVPAPSLLIAAPLMLLPRRRR